MYLKAQKQAHSTLNFSEELLQTSHCNDLESQCIVSLLRGWGFKSMGARVAEKALGKIALSFCNVLNPHITT
ncbi:hypothetical protein NIES2111_32140 [Nostoc sp. NIES-2111]|nr:hypothetical protein NIES2111_32140 [Nostoc sp. NIES-2111]